MTILDRLRAILGLSPPCAVCGHPSSRKTSWRPDSGAGEQFWICQDCPSLHELKELLENTPKWKDYM